MMMDWGRGTSCIIDALETSKHFTKGLFGNTVLGPREKQLGFRHRYGFIRCSQQFSLENRKL